MTTQTQFDPTGLSQVDTTTAHARDASHLRAIIAAAEVVKAADADLRQRVRDARETGDSWTVIGAALGVTKQAAQQRFSDR